MITKQKLGALFKDNLVLVIAGILALCSMLLVPPSLDYIDYIDFRVLTLLFCLMIVVSGFRTTGLFNAISNTLLHKAHSIRQIALVLIGITFISAMFITNDVALIAFVPLSILVLKHAFQKMDASLSDNIIITIIVLQTVAANLGSMLTPIGNPQNLYLYSLSNMSLPTFFGYTLPLTILSAFLILISCYVLLPKQAIKAPDTKAPTLDKQPLLLHSVLFLSCLLTVGHILSWQILLIFVTIIIFFFQKKLFATVDYGLLATFLCFFIFIGNIGELAIIRDFLQGILDGREILVSALLSQIISNVPASILLSSFTTAYGKILIGVNVGGLGTLIASLASLISWRQYNTMKEANPSKYFFTFTAINLIFFLITLAFALIFY